MNAVMPTGAPTPLPIYTPLTRELAARLPLVEVALTSNGRATTVQGFAAPLIKPDIVDKAPYDRANGKLDVVEFKGSFADAVRAANQLVLSSDGGLVVPSITGRQAHAVIDAGDGNWLLTGLATKHRKIAWLDAGTVRNVTIQDVKALQPAVKAVVGAQTWVNFTDEKIDPKLG